MRLFHSEIGAKKSTVIIAECESIFVLFYYFLWGSKSIPSNRLAPDGEGHSDSYSINL